MLCNMEKFIPVLAGVIVATKIVLVHIGEATVLARCCELPIRCKLLYLLKILETVKLQLSLQPTSPVNQAGPPLKGKQQPASVS